MGSSCKKCVDALDFQAIKETVCEFAESSGHVRLENITRSFISELCPEHDVAEEINDALIGAPPKVHPRDRRGTIFGPCKAHRRFLVKVGEIDNRYQRALRGARSYCPSYWCFAARQSIPAQILGRPAAFGANGIQVRKRQSTYRAKLSLILIFQRVYLAGRRPLQAWLRRRFVHPEPSDLDHHCLCDEFIIGMRLVGLQAYSDAFASLPPKFDDRSSPTGWQARSKHNHLPGFAA